MLNKYKAELFTCVAIGFALPGYYKVKYYLEGQLTLADIQPVDMLLEIVFAFFLGLVLVTFYRLGHKIKSRSHSNLLKGLLPISLMSVSILIAIVFTRFFFNYIVDWGSHASFEFDIALLALLLPLFLSGIGDKIFLQRAAEQAEKEALMAKFEALKARINPHFFFNSLNTIADLVDEDQEGAIELINHMAEFYRYILEHKDEQLVPLDTELNAVKSLLSIYEARLPGAVLPNWQIKTEQQKKQIVPMALQTLIENALKHNHYSCNEPLELNIIARENSVTVENSLAPRETSSSTKEGLSNLEKRVIYICSKQLEIQQVSNRFSVKVPLMPAQGV